MPKRFFFATNRDFRLFARQKISDLDHILSVRRKILSNARSRWLLGIHIFAAALFVPTSPRNWKSNMTKKKNTLEQRDHQRYPVQNGALVVLKPEYVKLGHIIDVSMDGLAFRYIDEKQPSGKSSELEIFFLDNRFHLDKIPCKTISDTVKDSRIGFRCCSVRFRDLTDRQRSQLEEFIKNHTLGEV